MIRTILNSDLATDAQVQISASITEDEKYVSRLKLFNWWSWIRLNTRYSVFIINTNVTPPTKSSLNSSYGSLQAGTTVYFSLQTGGAKKYIKLSDSNTSDWEILTPVLIS